MEFTFVAFVARNWIVNNLPPASLGLWTTSKSTVGLLLTLVQPAETNALLIVLYRSDLAQVPDVKIKSAMMIIPPD
ncbi:hypothetical protein D3C81_2041580 [compost metagenome]